MFMKEKAALSFKYLKESLIKIFRTLLIFYQADLATERERQLTKVRANQTNWLDQWLSGKLSTGSRV